MSHLCESFLWVVGILEMNNEQEVVMSSSPISKPKIPSTASSSSTTKKLTLVVDKTRFICNALIFNQHPNTLLGKMFSPHLLNRQGIQKTIKLIQSSKRFFIDHKVLLETLVVSLFYHSACVTVQPNDNGEYVFCMRSNVHLREAIWNLTTAGSL